MVVFQPARAKLYIINMDYIELKNISNLRREIAWYTERLARLEVEMQPGAQNLDGMPHAGGPGDPTARLAVEMADLRAVLTDKRAELAAAEAQVHRWLATVPDSITRQCIVLHYLDGLPWWQAADRIGGGNTAESCRLRAWRALRAEKSPGD